MISWVVQLLNAIQGLNPARSYLNLGVFLACHSARKWCIIILQRPPNVELGGCTKARKSSVIWPRFSSVFIWHCILRSFPAPRVSFCSGKMGRAGAVCLLSAAGNSRHCSRSYFDLYHVVRLKQTGGGEGNKRGQGEGKTWTWTYIIHMVTSVSMVNLEIPCGPPELRPFKSFQRRQQDTVKAQAKLNRN